MLYYGEKTLRKMIVCNRIVKFKRQIDYIFVSESLGTLKLESVDSRKSKLADLRNAAGDVNVLDEAEMDTFSLDLRAPLSPLVAFATCLAVQDWE